VNLTELITDLAAEVTAGMPGTIDLRLRLAPGPVHVQADPLQLSEALRHLVTNAIEAMSGGGTCTITSERVDDPPAPGSVHPSHAVITVRDTGLGMPPGAIAQAIDPFYTTKQRSQGTGLGLTTAYGIITQAGGKLSIESAPGEGTVVHLRLPVATTQRARPPRRAPAAPADRTARTVLVVDDDTDVRTIVERILTKAGYVVVTANDGEHALSTAKQHAGIIDCLVSDVMMPVMNGHELARRFTADHPGTPVLFMSGYAAALIDDQGILDPGSTVITKPFTRDELLRAVTSKLESAPRT
jgi:two-component system cell cycle sensor histidine kinase/response regulator CckA